MYPPARALASAFDTRLVVRAGERAMRGERAPRVGWVAHRRLPSSHPPPRATFRPYVASLPLATGVSFDGNGARMHLCARASALSVAPSHSCGAVTQAGSDGPDGWGGLESSVKGIFSWFALPAAEPPAASSDSGVPATPEPAHEREAALPREPVNTLDGRSLLPC
jgi:hypothetical protein